MNARTRRTVGFTLLEIMIVVAIMGLLAAVAIPQFTSNKEEGRAAAMTSNLAVLRTAIDSYWSQHDTFPGPTAVNFSDQLLKKTNKAGVVGTTAAFGYGPYLRMGVLPTNPFTNNTTVKIVATMPTAPSGTEAWIYATSTGEIRCNAVAPASVAAASAAMASVATASVATRRDGDSSLPRACLKLAIVIALLLFVAGVPSPSPAGTPATSTALPISAAGTALGSASHAAPGAALRSESGLASGAASGLAPDPASDAASPASAAPTLQLSPERCGPGRVHEETSDDVTFRPLRCGSPEAGPR